MYDLYFSNPVQTSARSYTVSLLFDLSDQQPYFIKPLPEEVEVLEGDATRLECRVFVGPGAEVTWYTDSEPVQEDDRITFETDGDVYAVIISPTEVDDEGEYTCVAKNEFGKASCSTELVVEEGVTMPIIKEPLKNVEASEGEVVRFDVRVAGDPEPVVEWFKDDHHLDDKGRVIIIDDVDDSDKELFSLVIEGCQVEDCGVYKVVAMSEAGTAESKCDLVVTRVTVPPELRDEQVQETDALAVESVPTHEVRPVLTMSEPVFTQKLQDLVVGNGEEVRFDARIIAVPEPQVEWFKGSTKVVDEGRFVHIDALEKDQFTLIIEQAEAGDSGRYKCVASNEMGTSSCTAELTVTEKEVKPETTDRLEGAAIGVVKGDELIMNTTVKGPVNPF